MTNRLALLAHEVRSPVAALGALAERAGRPGTPPDVVARLARLALAAGADVARLVADPALVSIRPVDVELADLVAGLAGERVTVDAGAGIVRCDPTRVRQALANLVANGLRHGTAVTVRAGVEDGGALFVVADDGPGVALGLDPFGLGTSGAGSTGYGLWIARGIAEAHGGTLELDATRAGGGASFRLVLPRASASR